MEIIIIIVDTSPANVIFSLFIMTAAVLLSDCPSYFCEHISVRPNGNFFKFGINTDLDLKMKFVQFGGQRSKFMIRVPLENMVVQSYRCNLRGVPSCLAQMSIWTHG